MTAPASRRWTGVVDIGDVWALWRGVSGDNEPHRHTAAQAVLALDGNARVEDRGGNVLEAQCVLVEPMALHRLLPGCDVELVFIEPWARSRHMLSTPLLNALAKHESATTLWLAGDQAEHKAFWPAWREAAHRNPPATPSAWSKRARAFIEAQLADGRVSLCSLAAHMALSADHTRHRFAEEVGQPFKRYVLWRRLRLAGIALRVGHDPTQAAHEAGFADAAHLARTLKSMFGVTVTQALR